MNVIGMIHLANGPEQALKEILLYQELGLYGALVENYFGEVTDVPDTLAHARNEGVTIKLGVNILPNEYNTALQLAKQFDATFIQVDYISGTYIKRRGGVGSFQGTIDTSIDLYGGVHPKYYTPVSKSSFRNDLLLAIPKTTGIVITGEGTGIETSLEKIKYAKDIIGNHQLIIGAGLNHKNVREQMSYAQGCIVGSCFKEKNHLPVDYNRVKDFMDLVSAH